MSGLSNGAAQAMRVLYTGNLHSSILAEPRGRFMKQEQMESMEACMFASVQQRVQAFVDESEEMWPQPEAALRRLHFVKEESNGIAIPSRGDPWPANVDLIALPEEPNPMDLKEKSKGCAKVLEMEQMLTEEMLGSERESHIQEIMTTDAFMDREFQKKEGMLKLAARLWKAGVLRGSKKKTMTVDFFTVVKKVALDELGVMRFS